ncbi:MAG: helix-turn-helix domain-containing protein [Alphaproteobacteria bacterium]
MSEKNSSSWQEKVLDPVAAHIGKRMRERREVLGLTSDDVARRVGMSLQQAEECEKGLRTVSGQDLWRFCQVLEVEPNYFFLGLQKKIILLSAEMRQERLREELYGIPLSREQEKRETAELTLIITAAAARTSFILLSDERDNVFCFERTGNLTRPIVRETAGLPGQAGQ